MKTSGRFDMRTGAFAAFVALGTFLGCATNESGTGGTGGVGATSTSTGSTSSQGGSSPCTQDCSKITTQACQIAVCNDGSYLGTIGSCVVVPGPAGAPCDDGVFCTVDDACDATGVCKGGGANTCKMAAPACSTIQCDEASKACNALPVPEGTACVSADLCQDQAVCHAGQCMGTPKDCSFSPFGECNTLLCNPQTGACDPTPNAAKNGSSCVLTGDPCQITKTCTNGVCGGGTTKDCSSLGAACLLGVCDTGTGACTSEPVPPGGSCPSATDQCNAGTCNANGECHGSPIANGTGCDDHRSCTTGDACNAGSCDGMPVLGGCPSYFEEAFETCPHGWSLNGGWECGTPTGGPGSAHAGTGALSTNLAGVYPLNATFSTMTADSPAINLVGASNPTLLVWVWTQTELDSDGANVQVSTDGGSTYSLVMNLVPAYDGTVNNVGAWTGDQSGAGWRPYLADLTAFVGDHVRLRFAFASGSFNFGNFQGIFIDDISVTEAAAVPLSITTAGLPNAFASNPYSATLARNGGSPGAMWSITGGTNDAWLTIDPTTGALSGTPTPAQLGPVTVTVRVEEPTVPTNFAVKTFNFHVQNMVYQQTFEGACPDGWTLTGDWQCGVPNAGPGSAYEGTQCIATLLGSDYNANDSFAGTTATSPAVSLVGATAPQLSFFAWVHTEGSSFDGFNLKVSTNGGTTFNTLATVAPPYTLNIDTPSQPAWGGDQSGAGWQLYTADLSAFTGQSVNIQFAFRSDGSVQYPGVYIDDVVVAY